MRLRRITLRNFKGVAAASVDIPAEGVTVIEGPNEAGKSSLAEAVDLIIEYLDSSGAADVKAAQPIGVDAGPEVEIELTVGAYHLVYRKRWLKHPETVLRILAPQPEQLSGR
ncbi:MAG: hypothetical protein H6R33_168, partial [Actinobacteria bacterium]|nr:hypothetical protein [Actinomycetota bacterium]